MKEVESEFSQSPNDDQYLTNKDKLLIAACDAHDSFGMLLTELGEEDYPTFEEQLELGQRIQQGKLWLFALDSTSLDNVPSVYKDRLGHLKSTPKAKYLLDNFVPKNNNKPKKEPIVEPLIDIGNTLKLDLQQKITDILNIEIPTDRDEEFENLFSKIEAEAKGGISAHEELVLRNTRLVFNRARSYQRPEWPTEEIFPEGYLGLSKAAAFYDFRLNFAFSTYAVPWINQYIQRALDEQAALIRLPSYIAEKLRRENRTGEISDNLIMRQARNAKNVASLNVPANEEEDTEFGDLLPDPSDTPEDTIVDNELGEILGQHILLELTEKESHVINRRAGVEDDVPQTLQEIGDYYDVSREWVRQMEKSAKKKLNKPHVIKSLEGYLT